MNEDDLTNLLLQLGNGQMMAGGFSVTHAPDYLQQEADQHALMSAQIGNMMGQGPTVNGGIGGSGGGGRMTPGSLAGIGGAYASNAQNEADAAAARAMQLQIAQMQNGTAQQRNNQDYQLGQGNLSLGQSRLALDDLLGKRSQQLQGAQEFATRATRQLAAPGGKLNPTLAPIMGVSSIAGPTPY